MPRYQPDTRFPDDLPNGPFRITRYVPYAAPVGDPVHRFFQMWQQFDGGRRDLFTWVATTSGYGAREHGNPAAGTDQGGVAMGFYSMADGDAAYLRDLARNYALADNYHQAIMGGTGPNYVALATGDVGVWLDAGRSRRRHRGTRSRIPSPSRAATTGTGAAAPTPDAPTRRNPASRRSETMSRVSPTSCGTRATAGRGPTTWSTTREPGLSLRRNAAAARAAQPRGAAQWARNIGTLLAAAGISWKWYSGGRTPTGIDAHRYCTICDPLVHSTAVMTSDLRRNLQGLDALFRDIGDAAHFPAVSFVVPPNEDSGHPAYSTVAAFENFVRDVVTRVQANPALWSKTAILVTTDESGGYYDSGYVQTLDFFGDGTRIPMLAVSPFARKGHVDHTYYDHASILKFVERNWRLSPLSPRSRDNLPNPVMGRSDPYVPQNRPAIGDLMGLFAF